MKRLTVLILTILHTQLQPAARTSTARVTAKPTPTFTWRGQGTQYLRPEEQYTTWNRIVQNYKKVFETPYYKTFVKIDTHPVMEKIKAVKAQHYAKKYRKDFEDWYHKKPEQEPSMPEDKGSSKVAIADTAFNRTDPSSKIKELLNKPNEIIKETYDTSDLGKKLPRIHQILDFHKSFIVLKTTQPELLKKIDPVVQDYNKSYQQFRRQPLNQKLMQRIHDKQRHLDNEIAQARRTAAQPRVAPEGI
ncbi:MAG: hypothetical protein NTZ68_00295 [Candidatus Dependentiae bacterium]|nr:hypothetical protein [Candidatus Dependentiae bacterium]